MTPCGRRAAETSGRLRSGTPLRLPPMSTAERAGQSGHPTYGCWLGMPRARETWGGGWTSSRLLVAGDLSYLGLRGFARGVDPSWVAVTCDADADKRVESV